MIQSPKIVRVNTAWAVALVMAVGLQLLLVMAVIASWMPAVYGSEVADIFPRGRTSFRQKYDLQIYHALILATFGLTFATAFIFKDRMSKEGWLRPLQRFVVMTLLWAALAYWSAFELIVHPATGVFKIVFSIAIAGNWLTWGLWLINPRWWLPLDSFIFTALAAFRKNAWVEKIIELGAQRALTERIALSICAVILAITHQAWLGPVSLPYWWPLRFTYVGLYTLSFALPIFYLMVTLIAMESLRRRASGYGRWCRTLGIAGLISFLVYVRAPIPVIPWLSLWPLIVLFVLALWKAASSGHGVWVMGIWKSVNVRVWVAVLGGLELGLICPWIQEQAKFPVSPSDFSTIVYFAFIAGSFAVYGLLPLVRTYEKLASFAVLQVVLVSLTSMAWFKLVVYDYRADLARFWFHWLGILILLQVFVWFALRWFVFWGKPGLQGIDAKYRSLITWIIILGLIFGATFIPNIEAMTAHIFMGEYNVHSDTYIMGPAWALAHGAVIDVDVYSRYGIGSVHFLLGLMNMIGGLSYLHMFTVVVWICTLYYLLVYVLYRRWLDSTALALAAWMMAFKAQIGFELAFPLIFTYPQSTVARQWPDIVWMILMLIFMQTGRRWALVLASLFVGFALWYMPSIGCYMVAAHAVITGMAAWRNPDWRQRVLGCVWPTGISLVSAFLMLIAICGHWLFSPVFWHNVLDFMKFFLLTAIVPLEESLTKKQFLNLIVFCIIVFVYLFTIVKVGLDYLNPKRKAQADHKDWLALSISIYGLGILEHYVTFSIGNNYYSKVVPFYMVLFHWISRGLAYVPAIWRKRISWTLAGVAFVSLITNHSFMDYPNLLNISSEPLLDKRIARPLPDGRPYFYHRDRFTVTPAMMLPLNNLGNTEDGLVTEYDFKNYGEMIARYRHDSDFSQDAQLISSLTGLQDKVVLLSSYEVRILMQANRKPFLFFFPLVGTRSMLTRSLPDDMLDTKSDLARTINDLEREKPAYIFMENVMSRDDIPPAYYDVQKGLTGLLSYVKANYAPYKEGHFLIAYKGKNSVKNEYSGI